jgi:hypothetical protein
MNRDHESASESAPAASPGFARAMDALARLRVACAELVASHERLCAASTALGHAATDMLVAASRLPPLTGSVRR